jgi:hypothetical protein
MSVVLYGCEVSFLTVQEENRLRVFENSVLKKKKPFEPKREKITGGLRKLSCTTSFPKKTRMCKYKGTQS